MVLLTDGLNSGVVLISGLVLKRGFTVVTVSLLAGLFEKNNFGL